MNLKSSLLKSLPDVWTFLSIQTRIVIQIFWHYKSCELTTQSSVCEIDGRITVILEQKFG